MTALRLAGAVVVLGLCTAMGMRHSAALQRRVHLLRAMAYLCAQMQLTVEQGSRGLFDVLRICAEGAHPLSGLYLAVADAAMAEPMDTWRRQCDALGVDIPTRRLLIGLGECCLQGYPPAWGQQIAQRIDGELRLAEETLQRRGSLAPTLGTLAGLAGAILML